MELHLPHKFILFPKRGKRMGVSFGNEFHLAGIRQLAETIDQLRSIGLHLVQRSS